MLTQAGTSTDFAVAAGETISASVGVSLSNAVGIATVNWSDFTLTLRQLQG